MATGLVLKTDNTTERIEISLDSLQKAVGGYVQALDFSDYTMWINEEGKLISSMEPNFIATTAFINEFRQQDVIMGDVVFTGGADEDGETLSLDEETMTNIEQLAKIYA